LKDNKQKNNQIVLKEECHSNNNNIQIIKINNQSLEDYQIIVNVLLKHFFMRNLNEDYLKEVIKQMFLVKIKENSVLVQQGTVGVFFYIVKEGIVDVYLDNLKLGTISKGESFGELALLHNSTRTSTVKSSSEVLCWCLDRRKFRKIIDQINSLNFIESKTFIMSIPILSNLSNDNISILCSNLLKQYFEKDQCIIKYGDTSNCMYIIKEGEVEVRKEGKLIRTLYKNDYFGDHSILLNTTRTMDVIAKSNSIVYSISTETLVRMFGNSYLQVLMISLIKHCFSRSKYFSKINLNILNNILDYFEVKKYSNNMLVYRKNDYYHEKIVVILEGDLVDGSTRKVVGNRGEILFEEYLIGFSSKQKIFKLENDVVTNNDCLLCEAKTELFLKSLGIENFKEIFNRFNLINVLNDVPHLKNVPLNVKNEIAIESKIFTYRKGECILKQGQVCSSLYIILNGDIYASNINNMNVNNSQRLNINKYFNDCCLFNEKLNYSVVAESDLVELIKIPYDKIIEHIPQQLLKYFKESYLYRSSNPTLDNLIYIRDLGESSIGYVSLVKCKYTHIYFACKSISKLRIKEESLINCLRREYETSKNLDFQFLGKVIKTIQTKSHVIFFKEYVNGCELFVAMNEIGIFNKYISQFYFVSILFAIDYLHQNSIVYRDVKPENVIISSNVS